MYISYIRLEFPNDKHLSLHTYSRNEVNKSIHSQRALQNAIHLKRIQTKYINETTLAFGLKEKIRKRNTYTRYDNYRTNEFRSYAIRDNEAFNILISEATYNLFYSPLSQSYIRCWLLDVLRIAPHGKLENQFQFKWKCNNWRRLPFDLWWHLRGRHKTDNGLVSHYMTLWNK